MRTFMKDCTPPRWHPAPALLICLIMATCAGPVGTNRSTGVAPPPAQPESASGLSAKPGWTSRRHAVAAANPLATEAGAQVLRAGGSAVDAAIAVQMVLIMGLLARTPQGAHPLNGVPKADWLHSDMEASRLAFADRGQYLADPDFVAPPAATGTACWPRATSTNGQS